MSGATNFHGYAYGNIRESTDLVGLALDVVVANAVQVMFSQCRSPKRALIRCRELCVPPVAIPPGIARCRIIASFLTLSRLEQTDAAVPWKLTVVPGACAGANNMNQ